MWGLAIAVVAAVFAAEQARDARLQRKGEADRLLSEAWDLLSDQPGAQYVVRPVSDPSKLELVRRDLLRVAALDPDSERLDLYWGMYYHGKKFFADALRSFQTSADRFPDSPLAYAAMAITLKDLQRPDEALAACRKAIARNRDRRDPSPFNTLGLLLEEKGSVDEAVAAYQTAIRTCASFSQAYYSLARLLYTSGHHAEALRTIRAAMQVPLDQPDSLLDLVPILVNMHAYQDALVIADQLLANDRRNAKALFAKGLTLDLLGKPADSAIQLQAAIAIDPHFAAAYRELALAYKDLGKSAESEDALRLALREDPRDAPAHFNLGQALAATNQPQQAIAEFRASIALAEGFAPAHFYLAQALEKTGDAQGAQEEYLRARALGMSPDWSRQLQHF